MLKKLSTAILIGTIVYFGSGWIVFDLLLGNYTEASTTQLSGFKRTEYSVPLLVVSCMAYATLMSYVLIFILNNKNLQRGITVGAIIGVLVAIMTDTYWYATSTFYSNVSVIILDILAAGMTVGFLGLAITWINRKS